MALSSTNVPPAPRAMAAAASDASYIEWPAILAGAVLATAVAVVLVTFGSGLGLSMISVQHGEAASLRWLTIAAGLWFLWVAVTSFGAGAYVAGRMRRRFGDATEDESETRDGVHGLLVWATGALLGAILATAGVTGIAGSAAKAVGGAAEPVATVLQGNMDYVVGAMLRGETASQSLSPDMRSRVTTIIGHSLASGTMPADDKTELATIVAQATGKDQAAAESQVQAALDGLDEARQAAMQAAESARVAGIVASFTLAATLLICAAVAYFAAGLGGRHRDENVAFRQFRR